MSFFKLVFTPESLQDINEAAGYYEEKQKELGKKFRNDIRAKLIRIKQSPHIYEVRYSNVRLALTDNFPYSIHFNINAESQTVLILAILNQSRDPKEFWKG